MTKKSIWPKFYYK